MKSLTPRTLIVVIATVAALVVSLALAGCQGSVGPAGPAGEKGAAGDRGPAGPAGERGPVGSVGSAGAPGPAGAAGAVGPQGPVGPTGEAAFIPADGLLSKIVGVTIGADRKPVVSFTLTDGKGQPLKISDLDGYPSFTIAYVKEDPATKLTEYANYMLSDAKGAPFTFQGATKQPALAEVKARPGYDPLPTPAPVFPASYSGIKETGKGAYTYTFTRALPEGYDRNATHVVAGQMTRATRAFVVNPLLQFMPAGGAVKLTRAVVATASCNQCHEVLAFHGGTRRETGYCVLCHTSQNTDPESGNTAEFKVMIHKYHRGKNLPSVKAKNPYYIVGYRQNVYEGSEIAFPQDIRNCTVCHGTSPAGTKAEDYAKMAPQANNWKTAPSRAACGACHDNIDWATGKDKYAGKGHPGGAQADDKACTVCHPADTGGIKAVAEAHKVPSVPFKHAVELSMTPPANGKFYVAGEAPKVTITIKDAKTGTAINPATIKEPVDAAKVAAGEWRRANFFVSGPRARTVPVLTTAATHVDPTHSYANNELRVLKDQTKADPNITRTATSIIYQLDDVKGVTPGTYTVFVETMPEAPIGGWQLLNFQVGTDKPELKVATSCTVCHGDFRMHAAFFAVSINPDICKNCHDYERQIPGKTTWAGGNKGFGAAPLVRRIHGVHYGSSLDKPKEIHPQYDYSEVTFPANVLNCTKCHSETTTWTEKPSQLACLACHDKDAALTHGALMTSDPTPKDLWSGDERETCVVCHGKDKEFTPSKVHVPPYRR